MTVAGTVVIDKSVEPDMFTTLNAANDLCPEGQPKPFPTAKAAAKVSLVITCCVYGLSKSRRCRPPGDDAKKKTPPRWRRWVPLFIGVAAAAVLLLRRR